jgi:hypothetical protein
MVRTPQRSNQSAMRCWSAVNVPKLRTGSGRQRRVGSSHHGEASSREQVSYSRCHPHTLEVFSPTPGPDLTTPEPNKSHT